MHSKFTILLMCLFAGIFVSGTSKITIAPVIGNLMVEYTKTPLGMDVQNPRFSWQMSSPPGGRGYSQTSYQLIVKDHTGNVVWDSKKSDSSVSLGILYGGTPLKSATRYNWTVNVWDQNGEMSTGTSWFETGLMNPDPGLSAWEGAMWIGGGSDDLVLQPHFLSVFKVNFTVQLEQQSGSTRAGFVLGANDSRLLDKDKNIYNIESNHNESYIKFELDISAVDTTPEGLARLNIYRAGYHPADVAEKPFMSMGIPQTLIDQSNKYSPHTIYLESVFGSFSVYINEKDNEHLLADAKQDPSRGQGRGGFNLNPVGQGGNYISFPLLADIGFSIPEGQHAKFSDVIVTNYREPCNKLFDEDLEGTAYNGIYSRHTNDPQSGLIVANGAYILNGGSNGIFIVADPGRNSMPMLRTEFRSEPGIATARLYVTARGIYEIFLNGKRVGNDYFNPGVTQYNITHMYQTYDVTDMIVGGGRNAMSAMLGEGWWSGNTTFTGSNWNFFGDRQSLLAKLVINYSDGTRSVITTNDKDWKYYNDGPLVYGSFFQGEYYNSLKEPDIAGWDKAGFDDSKWKRAVNVPLEGTTFKGGSSVTGLGRGSIAIDYENLALIGQIGENAGIVKELVAQDIKEVRPGVYVYDMGQNMVGVPSIKLNRGQAGRKITLRYAEVLYPDLEKYEENKGMIMLENIRAALAQDIFILKEGTNVIQARFTSFIFADNRIHRHCLDLKSPFG